MFGQSHETNARPDLTRRHGEHDETHHKKSDPNRATRQRDERTLFCFSQYDETEPDEDEPDGDAGTGEQQAAVDPAAATRAR